MAFKVGPMSPAAVKRHRAEQRAGRADLTARLIAAYRKEPDRAYAEDFYGSMLREQGVPRSVYAGRARRRLHSHPAHPYSHPASRKHRRAR